MNFKISVLIPAYQPDITLLQLTSEILKSRPNINLVIVNDGSNAQCLPIFEALQQKARVQVITHTSNQGKGAALKTGMSYWFQNHQEEVGIVTADADGQHTPQDIIKLVDALESNPQALHLGCRQLQKSKTPLRSWIGNRLTARLLSYVTQQPLSDTQTGLRGIPCDLIPELLKINSNGYAFETEMLLQAKLLNYSIKEHTIETVYLNANQSSHFNPLIDSLKIYWVFIRYALISLLSACIDIIVFMVAHSLSEALFFSLVIARIFSGSFNYLCNHRAVFKSSSSYIKSALSYLGLVALNLYFAYGLIQILVWLGLNVYWAKICTDVILFFINFLTQKFFIFGNPLDLSQDFQTKVNER